MASCLAARQLPRLLQIARPPAGLGPKALGTGCEGAAVWDPIDSPCVLLAKEKALRIRMLFLSFSSMPPWEAACEVCSQLGMDRSTTKTDEAESEESKQRCIGWVREE